jgi:hypothetical protein
MLCGSIRLYRRRLGRLVQEGTLTGTFATITTMNNEHKTRQTILEMLEGG